MLTAAGTTQRLWRDVGVGVKVAHESNPNGFQQEPAHPTRKDTPAGIQQGLQSIRMQVSQPRLLLERERVAGKSHELSGCQQTLLNSHPQLEAPAPSVVK